jgi:hypothetical protein
MVQHAVDIDRRTIERALIGEHFHAVDEGDDTIHLFADEAGEIASRLVQPRLQKLSRAPHARKRVFHFMSQDSGQCSHGARGIAAANRFVQPAGDGALLQRDGNPTCPFGQRRQVDGDHSPAERGAFENHFAVGNAGALGTRLIDEREQRTIGRDELGQRPAGCLHAKELGGGCVGVADQVLSVEGKDRCGKRLQQLPGINDVTRPGECLKHQGWRRCAHHAARRSMSGR